MSDENPYAPPVPRSERERPWPPERPPTGLWAKWAFLALGVAEICGGLVAGIVDPSAAPLLATFTIVRYLVAMLWIHAAYADLPRGGTSPGAAVGKLFIPVYNFYWGFAVNAELCRRIDGQRLSRGLAPAAPAVLATIAMLVHLVSGFAARAARGEEQAAIVGIPAVLAMVLWTVYMFRADAARKGAMGGDG